MFELVKGLIDEAMEKKTKKISLLFLGIDGAGKTTLVEKLLEIADPERTPHKILPTMGLNVESHVKNKTRIIFRDIGGKKVMRNVWFSYLDDSSVLVWVVSGNQTDRVQESRKAFDEVFCSYKGIIVFVFLNAKLDTLDEFPPAKSHTRFFVDIDNREEIENLYNFFYSLAG